MSQASTNQESSSPGALSQQPTRNVVGRQVKACSACRTTKIKCKMPEGVPPCERCRTRGIICQVDKNAQAILEESNRWQTTVTGQVAQLQTAVNVLLRMNKLPLLSSYNPESPESPGRVTSRLEDSVGDQGGDESLPPAPILTPVAAEDDSLYSLPINSLYEVTRLPSLRDPRKSSSRGGTVAQDFISRGLISEVVAEQLFVRFTTRLNYFCYGVLCPHDTLASLRESSPLLTAAVCAVASLHDPQGSAACKVCHAEFLKLVSASMLSISHSEDDIRAMIVGVYWLGNVSYTLLGHAIRVATRLNYHLAYFAVVERSGDEDDLAKARIWYILYILDHHSAILYGRPAIISPNEEPHQQWELFISANGQQEVDLRMSSQVALYHVISKVKDVFGGYAVKPVPDHCLPQLQAFFAELDRWYMVWGNRMPRNDYVGWFPRDGAILHYHFARLHLCSYIFRGMSPSSSATASTPMRDYASMAVASATAVLEIVLERDDMRTALVGMPLYFHGMITFAAVFLLKAARNNFWSLTHIDTNKGFDLVQSVVRELRSQTAAQQHLIYHISNGLDDMMAAYRNLTEQVSQDQGGEGMLLSNQPPTMDSMFVMDTFDLFQASIGQHDVTSMPGGQDYHWQGDYEMRP